MTEAKKGTETLIPIDVNKLNILVHPLFIPTERASKYPEYANARRLLYSNAVARFSPIVNDDVLIVMPQLKTTFRESRRNVREPSTIEVDNLQALEWTDLYHVLKEKTDYPENVLLADDIVFDPTASAEKMFAKILAKGFVIAPSTTITLGGEYLDFCVKVTTRKIFDLPFIQSVRIDTTVTTDTTMRNLPNTHTGFGRNYCLRSFEEGYDVKDDGEYIYISKKN